MDLIDKIFLNILIFNIILFSLGYFVAPILDKLVPLDSNKIVITIR